MKGVFKMHQPYFVSCTRSSQAAAAPVTRSRVRVSHAARGRIRGAQSGRCRQRHPSIMECQRHAFDFPQATDSNLCYLNSSYLGPYVATPATPAIIAAPEHLSD
jgi:hypothetical protein